MSKPSFLVRANARLLASLSMLLVAFSGCVSPGPESVWLTTPFTAAELHGALPTGSERVFRIEAEGGISMMTFRFLASDATGATIETTLTDADGAALVEPESETTTWAELRDHARFERAHATRSEATVSGPEGESEAWLYTVQGEDGSMTRLFFSKSLPGPPVRLEVMNAGGLLYRMEMVEVR